MSDQKPKSDDRVQITATPESEVRTYRLSLSEIMAARKVRKPRKDK